MTETFGDPGRPVGYGCGIQPPARPTDPATTERVRALCLRLPAVIERPSQGEAAWFAGRRQFLTMADHHHDDRLALWCAAPPGAQEALLQAAPDRFFRPPYVGHRGWIGVFLDVPDVDWGEVAAIVERAYRQVAPRSAIAELDRGAG